MTPYPIQLNCNEICVMLCKQIYEKHLLNLRMLHHEHHSDKPFCMRGTQRKGKQCGFGTTYNKGTLFFRNVNL